MPGHTSSACQKLNSRAENSPTSEMVKRAHVSTSGSSDEAAAVNPVISQPPGDPIETVRGGGGGQSSCMKHLPSTGWLITLLHVRSLTLELKILPLLGW
jgi:hypothetical protein